MYDVNATVDDYVYTKEIYNGFELSSVYVVMHDGIRLAVDIYRPTKDGKLHEEKLPCVWAITQYLRGEQLPDGKRTMLRDNTFFAGSDIERLIYHGYVIAVADVRGTGASFGKRSQNLTLDDMNDFRDLNEWLASREWCCGKTGMFGTSFLGRVQYAAAAMAAPSLKCIMPMVCSMEYPTLNVNGIMNVGWMRYLDKGNKENVMIHKAPPVDEDSDGILLAEATESHKMTVSSVEERAVANYMDSYLPGFGGRMYMATYFPNYLNNINNSGIAVYIWGGLNDFQAMGSFQWYSSLKTPKKMLVGQWVHTGQFLDDAPDWTLEHLRWYDYWLKGIDNGIMDEPPIAIQHGWLPTEDKTQIWTRGLNHDVNGPFPCCSLHNKREWRYYDHFPVAGMEYKNYYLHGGKSGSVSSVNDGTLRSAKYVTEDARDKYTVDYSVSRVGLYDRYMFQIRGVSMDGTPFDEKSLTYTTPALIEEMELIGFPNMHLWVSASVEEVDFYVTLEEVDKDGVSWQISESKIRTSFRDIKEPPFNNMGLPWHRYFEHDQRPLVVNEATLLEFPLFPLSLTVAKGSRLRVTVNNFDKDNWDTKVIEPAPTVSVHRDRDHPSYISLPVMKRNK